MSQQQVDDYLAGLDTVRRATLESLRRSILDVVPGAEQGLSYGAPAFRVDGKVVAGFSAAKGHLSYLPHSGSVLASVADDVTGFRTSKGALSFPVDAPLPDELVATLVRARLGELGLDG
jgi:uncharacterized protein YdhG (YjbR/CyaY superfamily)